MMLEEAICTDPERVAALLSGCSEEERRELAPVALAWYKKWWGDFASEIDGVPRQTLNGTVTLAVLGTANLTQIKKHKVFGHYDEELCLRVLEERRPSWLALWAEWMLEEVPARWSFIRKLERQGLIQRPDTDTYVLGMVVGARRITPLEMLRQDPELLREIPHLFRVEGGGENSLAAHDKYAKKSGWSEALLEFSQSGEISRDELLDRSLHALSLDFGSFRAGWFSRFHEALKPTLEERAARADDYLRLLQSRNGPTQSMALKALVKIARNHELNSEHLNEALQNVWVSSTKSIAELGMKLVSGLSEERQREHLTQALLHPDQSVVEAAMKALRKLSPNPQGDWRRRWLELSSDLPATLQGAWSDWLGEETVVEPVEGRPELGGSPEFRAIVPCESGAEVCQLASQLLEGTGTAWDIERCLDGMLRHRGRFPKQQALQKRAVQRLQSRHFTEPLAAVVLAWCGENTSFSWSSDKTLTGFLHLRLQEIEKLLRTQEASLSLLSLPLHEDGFVSMELGTHSLNLQPVDVAQGLLRSRSISPDLAFAAGPTRESKLAKLWPFKKSSAPKVCRMAALESDFHRSDYPWSWDIETRDYTYDGKTYLYHRLHLRVADSTLDWNQPREEQSMWRRWQSTVCPIGRKRWFLRGIQSLANNLDWGEADWADIVYLEDLGPVKEEWVEVEALLASFGLGCKEPAQFGLAVDQVARALQWGGLKPEVLGRALCRCAGTQMIKMNRWAKAIEELARLVDPNKVCRAFSELPAHSEEDLARLLPALAEVAARCDYRFEGKVKSGLKRYTGKGKAARAASLLRQRC